MEKKQEAISYHMYNMYLQLSRSKSEGCVLCTGPHTSSTPLLGCFPVVNDSSLQSKQLPILQGNAHLLSPYCKYETPLRAFQGVNRLAANKHKVDL